MAFEVFGTKKEAETQAIARFSLCQFETNCVNVIKVGPTIAKMYGVPEGWAIDQEMDRE